MARLDNTFASAQSPDSDIRCVICPGRAVCLQWYRAFSLHFEYGDVVNALDCLDDVLSRRSFAFSLGGDSFCACRTVDGSYYLLCRDHVVLRCSEEEARTLQCELAAARAALDSRAIAAAQAM